MSDTVVRFDIIARMYSMLQREVKNNNFKIVSLTNRIKPFEKRKREKISVKGYNRSKVV